MQVLSRGRVRVQGGGRGQAGAGDQRAELRPLQVLQVGGGCFFLFFVFFVLLSVLVDWYGISPDFFHQPPQNSIKMPKEYINWTVPEGGGGPSYTLM